MLLQVNMKHNILGENIICLDMSFKNMLLENYKYAFQLPFYLIYTFIKKVSKTATTIFGKKKGLKNNHPNEVIGASTIFWGKT